MLTSDSGEDFDLFRISFFGFFFRHKRCLVRVRVKDGRGDAEVSQWTLG